MNLEVHLLVSHQHSQFWPILAVLWPIAHRFGAPDRFGKSSTLAVLADRGPLRGVNLLILES